ncbi:hypothetical protein NDU88_002716, partial [Pleurodeles waltl]
RSRSSFGTLDQLEKSRWLPVLAGAASESRWSWCQATAKDHLEKHCTGGLKGILRDPWDVTPECEGKTQDIETG